MFKKIFLVVALVPTFTQACGDDWFRPLTPAERAAEHAAYMAHITQVAPHDDRILPLVSGCYRQAPVVNAEGRQRPAVGPLPASVRPSSRLGNGPRSPRLLNTVTGCVVLDGGQQ